MRRDRQGDAQALVVTLRVPAMMPAQPCSGIVPYDGDAARIDAERAARELAERHSGLSEPLREVLDLVAVDGLTPREAAQALGLNRATVRSRLHRARHPAPATRTPARRSRVRFTVMGVVAVTAVAAAAGVVIPTVSGSGSAPAYAVIQQDDGSLTLELRDTDGMSDLQDKLDELGVRARVLEGDDRCATGAPPEAPGAHLRYPMTFSDREGLGTVHFDPALFHEDETLLIVVGTREGTTIRSVSSRLVTQVPACSVPNIGGGPPAHA